MGAIIRLCFFSGGWVFKSRIWENHIPRTNVRWYCSGIVLMIRWEQWSSLTGKCSVQCGPGMHVVSVEEQVWSLTQFKLPFNNKEASLATSALSWLKPI